MNTRQATVDIPDTVDQEYAREALAAILYYNDVLSEKEARMMIGKTRRQFQEKIIPKFGLSMTGGTPTDAETEIEACRKEL